MIRSGGRWATAHCSIFSECGNKNRTKILSLCCVWASFFIVFIRFFCFILQFCHRLAQQPLCNYGHVVMDLHDQVFDAALSWGSTQLDFYATFCAEQMATTIKQWYLRAVRPLGYLKTVHLTLSSKVVLLLQTLCNNHVVPWEILSLSSMLPVSTKHAFYFSF